VQLPGDFDDANALGLADLRCREPNAGGMAHRVGQIVEQLVQVLPETVDWLAFQAQSGIAKKDDWSDTHGRRVYREP
jgi:hypothetical protein